MLAFINAFTQASVDTNCMGYFKTLNMTDAFLSECSRRWPCLANATLLPTTVVYSSDRDFVFFGTGFGFFENLKVGGGSGVREKVASSTCLIAELNAPLNFLTKLFFDQKFCAIFCYRRGPFYFCVIFFSDFPRNFDLAFNRRSHFEYFFLKWTRLLHLFAIKHFSSYKCG